MSEQEKPFYLTHEETFHLENIKKASIEAAAELLCEAAIRNRQRITFDRIYEYCWLKRKEVLRLIEVDPEFHIDLRCLVQRTNEAVHALQQAELSRE